MPLLRNELARWKNGQIELRPEPLRVRCVFDDLPTSDGHVLRCTFSCSVQGLADLAERRMLQEVLLEGRASVTDETLVAHFTPALRQAAARVVNSRPVDGLLEDDGKSSIADALRAAGKAVAFACGVELLPPFQVDAESPTLHQQRLRTVQRSAAEHQAAGQIEHFERAAEMLKRFHTLRASAPDLSAGRVLEQISPTDRGSVLQTLLLATASAGGQGSSRALWAVAGPYLVRIDAAGGEGGTIQPSELVSLPDAVGPLRSVQAVEVGRERLLLVGGRGGFMVVRPDAPSEAEVYLDPQLDSPLGFSRVIYWQEEDRFVGCHGDGGIVQWSRGGPSPVDVLRTADLQLPGTPPAPRPQTPVIQGSSIVASMGGGAYGASRAAGPRHLQSVGASRFVFALGSELRGFGPEGPFSPSGGGGSDIVAVLPDDRRLHVVHEDGTVCVRDRSTLEVVCRDRRTGRVRAAAALPWLGEVRLLLAGDDGPVQCIGFDDPLVTQYATAHRGLRLLAGSSALVAAVSPDRQRLILWNSWDGRRPVAEVAVAAAAKHRIADVTFG